MKSKQLKIQKNKWYVFSWKKKKYYGRVIYTIKNTNDRNKDSIGIVANDFRSWHLWRKDIIAPIFKKDVKQKLLNGMFSL